MSATPLDIAVRVARRFLDEADALDVGEASDREVCRSHGALTQSLRSVLDALDTDQPRTVAADAHPVDVLHAMTRDLLERLETRTAPWDGRLAEDTVRCSTTEQMIGATRVRLQAAIVDGTVLDENGADQ
jgi:hypothetical protein